VFDHKKAARDILIGIYELSSFIYFGSVRFSCEHKKRDIFTLQVEPNKAAGKYRLLHRHIRVIRLLRY
jgi:hypothetical protein